MAKKAVKESYMTRRVLIGIWLFGAVLMLSDALLKYAIGHLVLGIVQTVLAFLWAFVAYRRATVPIIVFDGDMVEVYDRPIFPARRIERRKILGLEGSGFCGIKLKVADSKSIRLPLRWLSADDRKCVLSRLTT